MIWAKAAVASFLTALQVLLAPRGAVFISLIVLMGIDFVFGVVCSFKRGGFIAARGGLSLSGLIWGVAKFFLYGSVLLVIVLLDVVTYDISANRIFPVTYLFDFAIYYLVLCEVVSILQHLVFLGMPVPEKLLNFILKKKDSLFEDDAQGQYKIKEPPLSPPKEPEEPKEPDNQEDR